ncbi:hypothetical protein [Leptospira mayottensis]|uniref:hypothetical protein n=1 Tax=Leptospira mayottensis TaxID=1137606 RepID=UPI000E3606AF|nr:hypothetical protein [Leptospira mayottensis]AXR68223.1 hypothetical protein DPV73_09500 [Leptospira mayottensis]
MTQQQRNDYIAEKILGAKKKILYHTWLHVKGKEFHPPFEWEFPKGETLNSRTNFEFLPEWVGPICEVVLPMLTKQNWAVLPIGSKVTIIELTQFESKEIRAYDFKNVIAFEPLVTALIDAHIKISGE